MRGELKLASDLLILKILKTGSRATSYLRYIIISNLWIVMLNLISNLFMRIFFREKSMFVFK